MRISSVEGNSQWLDGGSMFGNAPRAIWEKWIEVDEKGRIPLACRSLLLEIEGQKILCETGIGAFFEPKLADRFGVQDREVHKLLENLKSLGLDEGDIDYVILSHLHFDHAGGLLPTFKEMEAGHSRLLFPHAKYLVGKVAFERAKNPHVRDRASFIPHLTKKLKSSGRLIIIEDAGVCEKLPGKIEFRFSHGHTPGQMHTICYSEKTAVIFAGDLIPGTQWVHLPITMGYDRYPEMVINEKEELYRDVVDKQWWVFYTHDNEYSCSRIQNKEGRFSPIDLKKAVAHFEL